MAFLVTYIFYIQFFPFSKRRNLVNCKAKTYVSLLSDAEKMGSDSRHFYFYLFIILL